MKSVRVRYRYTFFQRQFVSHLILTLLVLVLISVGFIYFIKGQIFASKTDELNSASKVISRLLQKEEDPLLSLQAYRVVLNERKISFIVLDRNGDLLYKDQRSLPAFIKSKTFINSLKEQIPALQDEKRFIIEKNTANPLIVVPRTVKIKNQTFYVFVIAPVQGITETLRTLYKTIAATAIFVFMLAIAVSWLISRSMSRSVQELRQATKQIAAGDYAARSSVNRTDELGELAEDFNSMAQQLGAASDQLKSYEDQRRRFITDVTHELRTPLTSIRGIVEGLKNNLVSEAADRNKYYAIIEKETFRLIRLINELLDMERIQNGLVTLNKGEYPLHDVMEVVTESLEVLVEEKNLQIVLDCPPEVTIYGDYDRLTQIMINLVKNSLQFTAYGTIRLTGSETESDTLIVISDTGRGMTSEELTLIWDRFYKADPSRSKERSETGLGLSIVKQLVEAHGGTIEAESVPGLGSTFKLSFPKFDAIQLSGHVSS
jgi:signal transduction histidine kinase